MNLYSPEETSNRITMKVPNRDILLRNATLYPKEVIQKGYTDKIGGTIDFCGVPMKVVDVRVTDDYIFVDLER